MRQSLLTFITLALLFVLLGGCANTSQQDEPVMPEPDFDQPVSSDDPLPTEQVVDPDEMERSNAYLNSVDILIMESFPLQVAVWVTGDMPDGCSIPDYTQPVLKDTTFTIEIYGMRPVGAICTQALTPFELNIPLDVYGLPAGTYTVEVNNLSETFTFSQDNILQEDPALPAGEEGEDMKYDYAQAAYISEVGVDFVPGGPLLTIYGSFPDGCTTLDRITDESKGDRIIVTVHTRRPRDMMCTDALVDFVYEHRLSFTPPSGIYTLQVNDFSMQLTVH